MEYDERIMDMHGDLEGQGHQAALGGSSSHLLQGTGAYCGDPATGHTVCLNEKNRSEETQILRAGCNKAEPKKNSRRRPPFRGCGMAKI